MIKESESLKISEFKEETSESKEISASKVNQESSDQSGILISIFIYINFHVEDNASDQLGIIETQ